MGKSYLLNELIMISKRSFCHNFNYWEALIPNLARLEISFSESLAFLMGVSISPNLIDVKE